MAKLMLVEDDNNLREIYEARLQAEGYTIVTARDGEEALVVAKAEKPDLIISDVMMPKISGFEMLDILRNTDGMQAVKVIMLTALGQNDDQQRADRLGADRYLVKSQVTLEDIVKVAHELLQDSSAEKPAAPAAAAPATTTPTVPVPAPVEPAAAIPVVEPPAATPAAPPTDDAAQSTAQEEANVEARIEDFVAGATQDASIPAATPAAPTSDTPAVAQPAAAPNELVTPEPIAAPASPAAPSDGVADDKLMADAVQSLATSTADTEAVPDVITPPAEETAPATAPTPATTAQPAAPDTGSVAVAHKKVISPLDSEPKKDLETLVALEEAKQAAAAPPKPAVAVVVTDETGPSTDAKIDPNSIAL